MKASYRSGERWREPSHDNFGITAAGSTTRGTRLSRVQLIASRAKYLARMDELSTGGASLTRAPNADDLEERMLVGQQAGASWVAMHRGLK